MIALVRSRINLRCIYAYGVHAVTFPQRNIYNMKHPSRDNIGGVRRSEIRRAERKII
jgi:hypothetical protein